MTPIKTVLDFRKAWNEWENAQYVSTASENSAEIKKANDKLLELEAVLFSNDCPFTWNEEGEIEEKQAFQYFDKYYTVESYAEIVIGHILLKSWIFYYPDGTYEQLIMRVKLQ